MKHMHRLFTSLLIIMAMMFAGCDKIDPPYTTGADYDDNGGNDDVVQRVLLEEFTGHQCPNCPDGARMATQLKDHYGDNMVIIAIHAGWFANTDDDLFSYDFTTAEGDALADHFNVEQFPSGMVSRTGFDGSLLMGPSAWAEAIPEIISQDPRFSLQIHTSYDQDGNILDVEVDVDVLRNSSCNYRLSVFLTESGIIKPQKVNDPDYPSGVIEDYEHNHVLRAGFNGVWGDALNDTSIAPGMDFNKAYSLAWDDEWVPENSSVVAFVHHSLTEEVIQVAEQQVEVQF